MNSKVDHVWHVWINSRAGITAEFDKPCQWCGKAWDEHGEPGKAPTATSRRDRLCPVPGVTSQFYVPKKEPESTTNPPMGTMYAWKSAVQFMGWAARQIKKAREGTLPTTHQQCSHCKPEPIADNQLHCWLGQDVAKCPILDDLKACFDRERQRTIPDGRPSCYATITDDDVYEVMGYVCTWHLLMSSLATKEDQLPRGAFVDWNEGAFQDKSDRMFWARVYDSMSGRLQAKGD